jgi:pyruvate kinase
MSPDHKQLEQIIYKLEDVLTTAEKLTLTYAEDLDKIHPAYKLSAQNLILYLAFRQLDFDRIKETLESFGISQLTKDERHIKSSIEAVINNIRKILFTDTDFQNITKEKFKEGYNFQKINTTSLLGPEIADRITRIMVTLPSDAAYDYVLVLGLLKAKINCFRINCAHDTKEQWKMMVDNIQRAKLETGKECRICMDLSGPKVIRLKPEKNDYGIVVNPIRFWIAPPDEPPEDIKTAYLPVEKSWYKKLKKGTVVQLMDARGKKRKIKIIEESFRGKWATTNDTTYIRTGTRLHIIKKDSKEKITTVVGELIPLEEKILLRRGDQLIIHKKEKAGAPAIIKEDGSIQRPAHISCSLNEIFTDTEVGEPVLLDDGKIEGYIEEKKGNELVIRISWADDKGSTLRADKGINLPESTLNLRGLTKKDKEDLEFVARNADVVNVSFVNTVEDVEDIKKALNEIDGTHLGVILKIETKQGYRNLPEILLNAMQMHPIGVMIARGDLAVEVGWQKLAEVQEEILKICSAAHIPDIWATQVLENLAKKGRPSRAEITDTAMAQRADCIMLNKGPHIISAINMLDNIIRSMQQSTDTRKPKVKILD